MQADHQTAGDHFSVAMARNPGDDLLLSEYARYLLYIDRAAYRVAEVLRLYPAFGFDRFMAIFPYADPATMDRFRQSFVRAGLDRR